MFFKKEYKGEFILVHKANWAAAVENNYKYI